MDPTTTDAPVQEPGVTETQPEEQQAEAVTTPVSEPTTTPTDTTQEAEEPASTDNSEAEELDPVAFWSSKGIDVSTPDGLAKATKSYQEAQRKMHESTQKSSELEKQLTSAPVDVETDNPLVQQLAEEVVQMKRVQSVREFMRDNNITEEQNLKMGEWLNEHPEKVQLINSGYLSLNDAYVLSGVGQKNESELKSKGAREALESIANQQRATAPRGGATTATAPANDPIMDALLSED